MRIKWIKILKLSENKRQVLIYFLLKICFEILLKAKYLSKRINKSSNKDEATEWCISDTTEFEHYLKSGSELMDNFQRMLSAKKKEMEKMQEKIQMSLANNQSHVQRLEKHASSKLLTKQNKRKVRYKDKCQKK